MLTSSRAELPSKFWKVRSIFSMLLQARTDWALFNSIQAGPLYSTSTVKHKPNMRLVSITVFVLAYAISSILAAPIR